MSFKDLHVFGVVGYYTFTEDSNKQVVLGVNLASCIFVILFGECTSGFNLLKLESSTATAMQNYQGTVRQDGCCGTSQDTRHSP